MKIFSILLALCWVSCISCFEFESVVRREFEDFKMTHGKKYQNSQEELHRLKTFAENKKLIAEHNVRFHAGEVSFEMGLNQFSDMTAEEFASTMLGYTPRVNDGMVEEVFNGDGLTASFSIDWRYFNAVTRVKDQRYRCRASWAFSATGALESHQRIQYGRLMEISEQNLIDCVSKDGCTAGSVHVIDAFEYIKSNGGIDTEQSYPYEAQAGECRFKRENIGGICRGYTRLTSRNEAELERVVYVIGPVSVFVNSNLTSFRNYKSGIFSDPDCIETLNHAMLVIGYDQDRNGNEYWIVKNSWGVGWGEGGYMRLAKNRNNLCGIASDASYPHIG